MYASWRGYAYFCRENDPSGGFAAVPFSEKGGYKADGRQFSPEGLPVCAAGLVMPLAFTYTDRTTCLVEHERGKYTCPLPRGRGGRVACPIRHKNAKRGGCTAVMPTSIGARLRYTLDRQGEAYKAAYRQRTAVERTLAPARKCRCQLSSAGLGHRTASPAKRRRHCQPEYPHLCAHQLAFLAAPAGRPLQTGLKLARSPLANPSVINLEVDYAWRASPRTFGRNQVFLLQPSLNPHRVYWTSVLLATIGELLNS